jgi:hypothetical protein
MEQYKRKSSLKHSILTEEYINKNLCNFHLLKCIFCLKVSTDARVLNCCESLSCFNCFTNYSKTTNNCPECKSTKLSITKPNKFINRMFETIEYKCLFYKEGCTESIPHSEVEKHLKYCLYNPNGLKICNRCQQEYYTNEENEHVCLNSLIEALKKLKERINFYEADNPEELYNEVKPTFR